jgi:hypothetical protein
MYLEVARSTRRSRAAFTIEARVRIPHYWAVYAHDGRKPFVKGSYMVFWKDPRNDPRRGVKGTTPRRRSSLRSLSREEFLRAWLVRQAWIEAGGDPYDSPVIITKQIRKRTPPTRFFENEGGGMSGFREAAGRIAQKDFSEYVKMRMGGRFREKDVTEIGI